MACPGVKETIAGTLAINDPVGTPRGLVAFFGGGKGTGYLENQQAVAVFLGDLNHAGLETVQVAWKSPWLFSSSGEQAGPAALACRPATVVKWVHDHLYAPLGAHPTLGHCGYCIVGDSGGASQVTYPLADYGLAPIVNAAVPIAGPVHTDMAQGCLHQGDSNLWYSGSFSAPIIDGSYGFFNGGPCQSHDAAFTKRWVADSLDTGGRDFDYPTTRVVFMFGSEDQTAGPPHGRLFLAKLQADKSPVTSVQTVAGMGHLVSNSSQGLDALKAVLLAGS